MTFANSSIPQDYTLDIEPEGRLTLPKEIQEILNLGNSTEGLLASFNFDLGEPIPASFKAFFLASSSIKIISRNNAYLLTTLNITTNYIA